MTTLLVANRGEIALRIFRTADRMGMRTVAVYSDADVDAPHARAADVSVRIGPAPASESYLRADRILEAAREVGADLVHPGYGFLAEDDRFAQRCEEGGFTFVGPPSDVLRTVGDKASARSLAEAAGVPVLAGYAGTDQTDDVLGAEAARIGFPLIVKPSGGGGGKGMAVVAEPGGLGDAIASARRVAKAAFGDDRLILEAYIESPRHVEVQVFGDAHGKVIHLGERDCSLQRRHQKVMEETPAPNLADDVRARLHEAGVAFATRARYVGAGTCEFLVSEGQIGFIEMNARLQVEHPVTEMVTGLDLVELQLRVAMGEPLPMAQSDVAAHGHAIEVRVYAEDPRGGFLPQAGRIAHIRWPQDARVDAAIEEGTDVPIHYDPLLAKIVVTGRDRAAALDALESAITETEVLGVATNLAFLRDVTSDAVVRDGRVTTDWLERAYEGWRSPSEASVAIALAAAAETQRILARASRDPWARLGGWRAGGDDTTTSVPVRLDEKEIVVVVQGTGPFRVGDIELHRADDCHGWILDGRHLAAVRIDDVWLVWHEDQHEIALGVAERRLTAAPAHLDSPLPGQVIAVRVGAGEHVSRGQELVVVEAMKMEHAISAPADGVVQAVLCAAGDQVERGQPLVDFEPV